MKKRYNFFMFSLFVAPLLLASDFKTDYETEEACHSSEEEVTVNEDLMQEHGLLNRVLLVYEEMSGRLLNGTEGPNDLLQLHRAATVIRTILENHHEIMEETFIFPLLEVDGEYYDLVQILKKQHVIGRMLTDFILANSNNDAVEDIIIKETLGQYLDLYIRMFRPHESREGTIVFPKFRSLLTDEEYKNIGILVEEHEENLIGEGGFQRLIAEVAQVEQALGIYDLDQFTPVIP